MSTVDQIKQAIAALDQEQQAELAEWFWRRDDADDWDRQMMADIAGGKLDHLVKEAEEDIVAGRVYGLPGDPDAPSPESFDDSGDDAGKARDQR